MKIINLELLRRIKINYRKRKLTYIVKIFCEFFYYTLIKRRKTFNFRGRNYLYFYHWYNTTWRNPRAVEVPVIMETVMSSKGKRILEVGNVLSHYFHCQHDILDKYEKAKGVINQDVVGFSPTEKYDLIVSISTFEHIGLDEKPREPRKILRAFRNLKNRCLASGGQIIFTIPLGYNVEMDKLLAEKRIPLTESFFLKRISNTGEWQEVHLKIEEIIKHNFHRNVLLVGVFTKD